MNKHIIRIALQCVIFIWISLIVLLIGYIFKWNWFVNLFIPFVPLYNLIQLLNYDDMEYTEVGISVPATAKRG
jgi:hypothetical protein